MTRFLMIAFVCLIALPVAAQEGTRTFEGQWNNRKFGTSGPLRCVAKQSEEGVWEATFTGLFRGDPFEFDATFNSRKGRQGLDLSGNSTVRGHKYQWTGSLREGALLGRYRSSVGYYGEFRLREKKSAGR